MAAKKLTQKELKWLERLEKVMQACPSKRLQAFTIGDNDLTFYDKPASDKFEEDNYDGSYGNDPYSMFEEAETVLYTVRANFYIDSLAG